MKGKVGMKKVNDEEQSMGNMKNVKTGFPYVYLKGFNLFTIVIFLT